MPLTDLRAHSLLLADADFGPEAEAEGCPLGDVFVATACIRAIPKLGAHVLVAAVAIPHAPFLHCLRRPFRCAWSQRSISIHARNVDTGPHARLMTLHALTAGWLQKLGCRVGRGICPSVIYRIFEVEIV